MFLSGPRRSRPPPIPQSSHRPHLHPSPLQGGGGKAKMIHSAAREEGKDHIHD